jgi:hypothetical protein
VGSTTTNSGIHPLDKRTRMIFKFFAIASLVVMAIVLGYALISSLTQNITIVGENFVDVEFPPPSISPIYLKPITYLYVASLVFIYTTLELYRERIRNLPDWVVSVSRFFAFMVMVVFFFELAYNLVFWGGEIAAQAVLGHLNPDVIVNPFPELTHPWNVVFASKLWTVFLLAGAYVYYFLGKVQSSKGVVGSVS